MALDAPAASSRNVVDDDDDDDDARQGEKRTRQMGDGGSSCPVGG